MFYKFSSVVEWLLLLLNLILLNSVPIIAAWFLRWLDRLQHPCKRTNGLENGWMDGKQAIQSYSHKGCYSWNTNRTCKVFIETLFCKLSQESFYKQFIIFLWQFMNGFNNYLHSMTHYVRIVCFMNNSVNMEKHKSNEMIVFQWNWA